MRETNKLLEVAARKHNDWVQMAKSFKLSDNDANELVQEMYIAIDKYVKDVDDVMYNENEINTFYIYTTLRNLFWQKRHKGNTGTKTPKIVYENELIDSKIEQEKAMYQQYLLREQIADTSNESEELDLDIHNMIVGVDEKVSEWNWYNRKIFYLYFWLGIPMRRLSKSTTISLSSIFNTISNSRKILTKELGTKWKNYKTTL